MEERREPARSLELLQIYAEVSRREGKERARDILMTKRPSALQTPGRCVFALIAMACAIGSASLSTKT